MHPAFAAASNNRWTTPSVDTPKVAAAQDDRVVSDTHTAAGRGPTDEVEMLKWLALW